MGGTIYRQLHVRVVWLARISLPCHSSDDAIVISLILTLSLRFFFHNAIHNERIKQGLRSAEKPTQMGSTARTDPDLPAVSGKPCKFGGFYADKANPADGIVAGNFKNNAAWICKGMLVRSVNRQAVAGLRESFSALPANDP